MPSLHKIIMDTLEDGVIFLDASGVVVACNRSAMRILGVRQEDILGTLSVDPVHFAAIHEDGTAFAEADHPSRVVLRTGLPCLNVVQGLVRPGSEHIWVSVSAMPVPSAAGWVRGVVVSIHDISHLKRLEHRLREEAIRDELTGLYNRRYLSDQLARTMNASRRHGYAMCLCLCDLDHFKRVNDTYGHAVGDLVICAFAQILASHLRQEDVAARIGGDEFCLLFTHSPAAGARIVLERIRAAVNELQVPLAEGQLDGLTASFGLTPFQGGTRTASELMDLADKALYQAKGQGRDRIVWME